MNFKRYHVSKQLFDKDTATIYTLYAGNGDIIRTSSNARSIAIPCTGGEIYTVSKKAGQRFMVCFTTEPIANQVPYTNLVTDNTATSITAEAPEGAKYLFVYFYNSTADTDTIETLLNSIMINTGSTPQPYEPYSSEVWHDTPHYVHNTSTDIITTLPAVIYPTGTTATVGLKGQTTQSSIPSPTSPVMPQGTGDKTANLIEGMFSGSIGTTGGIAYSDQYVIYYVPVTAGETYTISGSYYVFAYYADKPTVGITSAVDNERHFTSQGNTITVISGASWIGIRATNGDIPMVNLGSTALPYENFGYKIPISSASTTTPVYLGEVQSTRRIKKIEVEIERVLTLGNGNKGGVTKAFSGGNAKTGAGLGVCDRALYGGSSVVGSFYINQANAVFIGSPTDTLDDFKSKYNGASLWYVLATEETAVVNEPLMKIGDYADTVSGITIPTIAGANTIDIDTTLKPSEVTVNYHGWHPVSAVHERESGAWT